MRIEIWSDVRCPFCYIGKRKFEAALKKFPQKDQVEVIWRSFQLDPQLVTQPEHSVIRYFTESKGVSKEQAEEMLAHAIKTGEEIGLDLKLKDTVLANSFNAHRLIQMAKAKGRDDEMEEALFHAHFTDLKNIDSIDHLMEIGTSVGLDKEEVTEKLASDAFEYEVKQDEMQARNIGVRGVPFFVFNNKYAISGAQSPEAFLQALEKAWEDYTRENPSLIISKGDSCTPDGTCQ